MEAFPARWWTSIRIANLGRALRVAPPMRTAIPLDELIRAIWRANGGSREELLRTVGALEGLRVVANDAGLFGRTPAGEILSRALASGDMRPLGLALLESGLFHEQGRVLFEVSRRTGVGDLECPAKAARKGAAQLLAVLELWPDVQTAPIVLLPAALVVQLDAMLAVAVPSRVSAWAALRKQLGDRAELFTYLRERSRPGIEPSRIAWVSRDSDTLGWDVEDRSATTYRRIQVKGSREVETPFYPSENEFYRAREYGVTSEAQVRGRIHVSADGPSKT